jgi:hypothetical protein
VHLKIIITYKLDLILTSSLFVQYLNLLIGIVIGIDFDNYLGSLMLSQAVSAATLVITSLFKIEFTIHYIIFWLNVTKILYRNRLEFTKIGLYPKVTKHRPML